MQSADVQIKKFSRHLASFASRETPLCIPFLDLLRASPEAHLECSCKVYGDTVNPARFNLWYKNNGGSGLNPKIVAFLEHYAEIASIDRSLYYEVTGTDFLYEKVRYNVVGIDLRPDIDSSRIKLWHIVGDYPAMETRALGFAGISPDARRLKVHKGFLFGFDFVFSGASALKVYPVMHDYEIREHNAMLRDIVGEKVTMLAEHCHRVSFGFSTDKVGASAHMIPYDASDFIAKIGSRQLSDAFSATGSTGIIVAMDVGDINSGEYHTFNLYY
ncbi:MAG: hypothetical protein FIB08_15705 [Candidatus Methanoperedens sp.]|nr:hypothetical protein [Candidatus Methanoperedens sp.]